MPLFYIDKKQFDCPEDHVLGRVVRRLSGMPEDAYQVFCDDPLREVKLDDRIDLRGPDPVRIVTLRHKKLVATWSNQTAAELQAEREAAREFWGSLDLARLIISVQPMTEPPAALYDSSRGVYSLFGGEDK